MSQRNEELKQEWDERQKRLGNTPHAVLFKRFPDWLNRRIHRGHADFITRNLPAGARAILDVGCGYGRISEEIRKTKPGARLEGVELCTEFAAEYRRRFGACFNGPIQDYEPAGPYDAIVMVTILMYLEREEIPGVLEKLWRALRPGGRMILIESAVEFGLLWRRLTFRTDPAPTGGRVTSFSAEELARHAAALPAGRILGRRRFVLAPGLKATALHHGLAIEKH